MTHTSERRDGLQVNHATLLIENRNFLSSPYYFMCATLHDTHKGEVSTHSRNADIAGNLVSSLHRVKDTENNGRYASKFCDFFDSNRPTDVGYFVFQDLSVRKEGDFCLKFSLFELQRYKRSFFLIAALADRVQERRHHDSNLHQVNIIKAVQRYRLSPNFALCGLR